jgi:hypothetical protein
MDDETRAAFARMDRWFELNQAQYSELRTDLYYVAGKSAIMSTKEPPRIRIPPRLSGPSDGARAQFAATRANPENTNR